MRGLAICVALWGCADALPNPVDDLALPSADLARTLEVEPLDLAAPLDLALRRPKAVLSITPDLVGFTTALDGSKSSDPLGRPLAFAWHVAAAPAGATINDAQLAALAKTSFEPDRGGDWTIALTVTTPDGASDTASATATVATVPLFFYAADQSASASHGVLTEIRSDGAQRRFAACPLDVDAGAPVDPYALAPEVTRFGLRAFEPPDGKSLTRIAFLDPQPLATEAGVVTRWRLLVGDEKSDCLTRPPTRVDDPDAFADHPHLFPRWSPGGHRIAYLDGDHGSVEWRLVTVGSDGSDRHIVRGPNTTLYPTPPVWTDETHLAWVENRGTFGAPQLIVYQAADTDGPAPATLYDCYDAVAKAPILTAINQLELLPTGGAIVAGSTAPVSFGAPDTMALYKMTTACSVATPLAAQSAHGQAFDFALSPDGKTIVMASNQDDVTDATSTPPLRDLYVVPADGSGAPRRLAGAPGVDDFGPRWLAGGRQIVWTQQSFDADAGNLPVGGGIMIMNADGTHVRSLAAEKVTADGGTRTLVLGGSNQGHSGCSFYAAAPSLAPLFFVVLFALLFRRRAR